MGRLRRIFQRSDSPSKQCMYVLMYISKNYVVDSYGNTGCRVFKQGGTKLERFLHKNQHTKRKLLNLENQCNGEVSKIGHQVI